MAPLGRLQRLYQMRSLRNAGHHEEIRCDPLVDDARRKSRFREEKLLGKVIECSSQVLDTVSHDLGDLLGAGLTARPNDKRQSWALGSIRQRIFNAAALAVLFQRDH
jgi:hypothetical protein